MDNLHRLTKLNVNFINKMKPFFVIVQSPLKELYLYTDSI